MNASYGPPPETDSEDEYDGFYFSDDLPKTKSTYQHVVDKESLLSNALSSGDLSEIMQLMEELKWPIEKPLHNNLTPLQLSSTWGQVHVVKYLVNELKADVNFSKKSMPPLMLTCQSTHATSEVLVEIVKFLIEKGATTEIKDMYRCTPLMAAAALGHVHIVQYLIKHHGNYRMLEMEDNNGETALFHAIENNKPEVIKLLLEAGVRSNIVNFKGYSPIQAAQFYGFNDLLNILPKPCKVYNVPAQYAQYNMLRDYIPQIFAKTDNAPYSQEVVDILRKADKMGFLQYFSTANVSLETFLNIDDQDLIHLGFHVPIQRKMIKRLLLRYFLKHWEDEQALCTYKEEEVDQTDFHKILMMIASQLRQLVVLKCTLRYIRQNLQDNLFGPLPQKHVEDFEKTLTQYENAIKQNKTLAIYLNSFSPAQNILYINYDNYIADKQQKRRSTVRHTALFVGISLIIYLKLRKFF